MINRMKRSRLSRGATTIGRRLRLRNSRSSKHDRLVRDGTSLDKGPLSRIFPHHLLSLTCTLPQGSRLCMEGQFTGRCHLLRYRCSSRASSFTRCNPHRCQCSSNTACFPRLTWSRDHHLAHHLLPIIRHRKWDILLPPLLYLHLTLASSSEWTEAANILGGWGAHLTHT